VGEYVSPDKTVAEATPEQAHVVAFDLGDCDGTQMYRRFGLFFPQHGQTFDPATMSEDVCRSNP
jgi:hypothetical protein